jgi:molybdate ABC transporter permease protein/molybdenum ABC transporter molybdate-binding protein
MSRIAVIPLVLVLCVAPGCNDSDAGDAGPITLFAAASTTGAITDIARAWEKHTGLSVRVNTAASSTLARQIQAGAPADVYISANSKWMDVLADDGAIRKNTRRDILTNRLAVIAPVSGTHATIDLSADAPPAVAGRWAIGDPTHVPAGMYTRESLGSLGWWDALKDRLAPAASVRAALRFVEQEQCPIGIVYSSDAATSSKVRRLALLPEDSHSPIRYPAALCKGAHPKAEALLTFLSSPAVREIWQRYGFSPINAPLSAASGNADQADRSAAVAAALLSVKVALGCVAIVAVPGIAAGWLLARKQFPGKALLDALVHAPLVMPPVVTGYLLLVVFGAGGPAGRWLDNALGISLAFTWTAAVLASAVVSFPLLVRSVRVAVELVDRRLEQAGATLGASPWVVLRRVTLPLALPGVLAGLVLAFARSMGEFGATATFAGNIPGQTRTLPLAIFSATQTPGGDEVAMTLAGVSVLISVLALAASEVVTRRLRARLETARA